MPVQYVPPPVIVPVNNHDNGAWRAHAMHCPKCHEIYEREQEIGGYIVIGIIVVIVGLLTWAIREM